MAWWDEVQDRTVEWFDCPYCNVRAGHECVTTGGHIAHSTHGYRGWDLVQLVNDAWNEGWNDGVNSQKRRTG